MNQLTQTTLYCFLISLTFSACGQESTQQVNETEKVVEVANREVETQTITPIINPEGTTLESRINPPQSFKRLNKEEDSFASYLRKLPLKSHGTSVLYYNGGEKVNYDVYDAVVDLPIGKRDLHQCADAVMRLRAEYLWQQKKYDQIHFNFTSGFRVDYSEWMKGKRISLNGNKATWRQSASPSNTYKDFWKYMELIFSYAGTASLSKELQSVELENMKIGDVFIQGGFPGHAVIVADMVQHPETDEKLFLLAQSYMPAQEIQILKNPNNNDLSPWYALENIGNNLFTPEWNFTSKDLKRFSEN